MLDYRQNAVHNGNGMVPPSGIRFGYDSKAISPANLPKTTTQMRGIPSVLANFWEVVVGQKNGQPEAFEPRPTPHQAMLDSLPARSGTGGDFGVAL